MDRATELIEKLKAIPRVRGLGRAEFIVWDDVERILEDYTPWGDILSNIKSNPSDWQAYYVLADRLEDAGFDLEAEKWRFRGQIQGWAVDNGSNMFAFTLEFLREDRDDWSSDYNVADVLNLYYLEIQSFCERKSLRFIPEYPYEISRSHQ